MCTDRWHETRKRCYYGVGCCTSTRRKGSHGSLSRQPSAGPHRPTDRVGDRPPEGRIPGPDFLELSAFGNQLSARCLVRNPAWTTYHRDYFRLIPSGMVHGG